MTKTYQDWITEEAREHDSELQTLRAARFREPTDEEVALEMWRRQNDPTHPVCRHNRERRFCQECKGI